jgi:hypothetical protein
VVAPVIAPVIAPVPAGKQVSTNGQCGSKGNPINSTCPAGQCCSSSNWCSTGDAYCGIGNQATYNGINAPVPVSVAPTVAPVPAGKQVSTNGQCGIKGSPINSICPDGLCCSPQNWCSTGDLYCGVGNQVTYNGKNAPISVSVAPTVAPVPVGKQVSTNGQCGSKGNPINSTCPAGQCCSSSNWCSTGDAYCGIGNQAIYNGINAPIPIIPTINYVPVAGQPYPISSTMQCGDKGTPANSMCPKGNYCSSMNWCGPGLSYQYDINPDFTPKIGVPSKNAKFSNP